MSNIQESDAGGEEKSWLAVAITEERRANGVKIYNALIYFLM